MYCFNPLAVPAVPVVNSDKLFPVHRIYCVGRNYADHAREMGSDPAREPPCFFMKPADAVVAVASGSTLSYAYPTQTKNFHHEGELVIAIGKSGSDISVEAAMQHVFGFSIGIDFTRRDLQTQLKNSGQPWEVSKAFDRSAPLAPIKSAAEVDVSAAAIWLTVNGEVRQHSNIGQMIWSVAEIVSYLSRFFELREGDLIFTGTPAGVGAVVPGDLIECGIDGLGTLRIKIK